MNLDARVSSFAKRASSVEHRGEIICAIKRSEIAEINQVSLKSGKTRGNEQLV